MPYEIKATSQFKKDYKLIKKQGKDTTELEKVIDLLAAGNPLPPEYGDHPLGGDWKGHRDCHIAPDWLLIYRRYEHVLVLSLVRTGSHSDIFK